MPEVTNAARQQYLASYASLKMEVSGLSTKPWLHAVAVPAYAEFQWFPDLHRSLVTAAEFTGQKSLLIVCVNNRKSSSDVSKRDNAKLLHWLLSLGAKIVLKRDPAVTLIEQNWLDIMVIDCASPGAELPDDQGVGLARKICGDVSALLFDQGHLKSPWLFNTDGDARVPESYFRPQFFNSLSQKTTCVTLPFSHVPCKASCDSADYHAVVWRGLTLYERFLRYYENGLRYAMSPYGLQTIGSTLVCHLDAYVKVRGFPKRMAGEDFYLVNKLAKLGPVVAAPGEPILLIGRDSDRVPFGTGAAMKKISQLLRRDQEYTVYQPQVFEALKIWLAFVRDYFADTDPRPDCGKFLEELLSQKLDARMAELAFGVISSIDGMGQLAACRSRSGKGSGASLRGLAHFHTWFDGFRTLKFVHGLRDAGFRDVAAEQAFATAHF